ncbi:MAG: HAD family phosphatase, partial [Oscillospiraceae bacterium]|nr:HAD family phosphatase [Oscillospiraceae bacterium]
MKTLYVSDLDGTLLRSDERISALSCEVINGLVEKGMLFSYATARSLITAKKVTKGLSARIPLIIYNGAFIVDNVTEEILLSTFFDDTVQDLLDKLFGAGIYPIVYAYIDGREKFSFVPELCTEGMK